MATAIKATAAPTRTIVVQITGSFTQYQERHVELKVPATTSAEAVEALLADEDDTLSALWHCGPLQVDLPTGFELVGYSVEDEFTEGDDDFQLGDVRELQSES